MTSKATRREFCQRVAGGTAWAVGAAAGIPRASSNSSNESAGNSLHLDQTQAPGGNLLTNPRYTVGAKFRLAQFIQRGADAKDAEAIFRQLTDLEPQRWVDEWTRLAEPWEQKGAEFAGREKSQEAREAFQKASMYYGVAKFPVINHPAKQAAYQKCIKTYLNAARYFDPPLERVTIPFEGREIVGYLRIPRGVSRPPVVIATGGIDVYKEERDTSDLLDAGLAAFSTDMPGNGECPEWYTADAGRTYSAVIDYLEKRNDLDGKRLGIVGRSYGGYWAGKMAYVESKRIRAAVEWGGPVHYTFQEPWLQHLQEDKLYLWPFLDSMVYAHHVKDIAGLREQAPTLSLKTQGWLDKPSAPMLVVNGAKDPWITIQDLYLLLESGEPKSARVYPEAGHMGAVAETGKLVMSWLKAQLAR
ncbi:MAG TPA: alpha/beta fold hydrolase [Candidatus Sulfotelmatobacter sp.]|jgi:esterase FrsA|nr:alpha/beta fold hydrolase [Candidatus Sulfotelmatobacter sp.]